MRATRMGRAARGLHRPPGSHAAVGPVGGCSMTTVSFFSSGGPGAPGLARDLESVGLTVGAALDLRTMVQDVIRSAPDVVVCYENHPGDALFAITATLQDTAPRPFVLFTADPDAEKIERAAGAGVHAYVVDGYAPRRLRSVIHVAQARFRRDQALRAELSDVRDRFSERKLVDRAKGILMRVRNVPEEEAFKVLRSAAMQSKQRIGQVAQQVIDATRYADAINRAGQLRMLSQRIVKLNGLGCAGIEPEAARRLCDDSVAQADANLAVLGRSLSRATFGDLLDGVLGPWSELKAAVRDRPTTARLAAVDALAERLLGQAEALTRNLETAGFAAALRIINVSGRQRMLSQRIAKGAILSTLIDRPGDGDAMRRAEADFEQGLAFLAAAPLSTGEIQAVMGDALQAWAGFRHAIADPVAARRDIAVLSETLLARFGELTALYEQGIQTLMA